jgi:hypothetical protein
VIANDAPQTAFLTQGYYYNRPRKLIGS